MNESESSPPTKNVEIRKAVYTHSLYMRQLFSGVRVCTLSMQGACSRLLYSEGVVCQSRPMASAETNSRVP